MASPSSNRSLLATTNRATDFPGRLHHPLSWNPNKSFFVTFFFVLLCGLILTSMSNAGQILPHLGDPQSRERGVPRAPQFPEPETPKPPRPPRTGLHLTEAFLPLQVGNRWTYDVEVNGKKRPKPMLVEITKMVIKNFRSYYLFSGFPFAPSAVAELPVIRFDRRSQTYFQLVNDQEVELYPEEGEHRVEVKAGETASGQPDLRTMKLSFPPQAQPGLPLNAAPATDEVVFKYGEGVVAATRVTVLGVEKYTLIKTEQVKAGARPPAPAPPVTHEEPPVQKEPPSPYAKGGPQLELSVNTQPGKVQFTFRVHNNKDKMIPLNFADDQSFDFLVSTDPRSMPMWQWSTNRSFTKVKRSRGLLPDETLEFSTEWDGLDTHRQPVAAGKYFVIGILTTTPEQRTPPVEFSYTPAPAP